MANRAVITTRENYENNGIGVYLHWCGSRSYVESFLRYCELKKYRYPESDPYGWAYLCHVLTNYFGDGLSVGVDVVNNLNCANGDNGVYIIKQWRIVGRELCERKDEDEFDPESFLHVIDGHMPPSEQLYRIRPVRTWGEDPDDAS